MRRHSWQRRSLLLLLSIVAFALIGATLTSSIESIRKPFPGFYIHQNMTVGPFSLPYWSGAVAGLKPLDLITSVDGKPLERRDDLYRLVKSAPPGTSFQYRVQRGPEALLLTISSATLAVHDWFLTFGIYLLMGVAFLIIGVAPYYFHASSPAALPLCFMVMAVFIWFATTFDFMTTALFPKELRVFAVTFTPSAGIHLAFLLKSGEAVSRARPVLLGLIYGTAVILGTLNSLTFFGPVDHWIFLYRAAYIYTCIGALAFLAILGSALRGSLPNLARSRLRVIFAGAVLGFLIPTASTVLTSSFQWSIPYNLALIPTIFFPLSVAFALLKYSLFDLGNAFKVALSRVTLTAFLLAMYVAVVIALSSTGGVYGTDPLAALLFSVLVVLFFNPALRGIERVVDRYIYGQEYDPVQVQEEVSLYLRSLGTLNSIAEGFVKLVSERIGLRAAGLVYRPKGARASLNIGEAAANLPQQFVDQSVYSLWNSDLERRFRSVSRGEIADDPRFHNRKSGLLIIYQQLQAEVLVPIVFEREIQGFAYFGAKRSDREHSSADLRLLETLTDQLALSLENSRLFDESVKAQEQYRRLYNDAERANRQLLENDRVKREFVANICHELRTPISAIIGYSEVLLDPNYSGDHKAMLQKLVYNGQSLSDLMDTLMDFSRLEANAVSNRLEPVNVKEILGALEMMMQRLIRGRPIDFKLNIESAIETIQSDARKLQQILVQLLTNAVKFTEKGTIELRMRSTSEAGRPFLEIALADTGIGIDKKDQEIIFEEFRQLDGSSARHYGGTGLGLSLCQKLAGALGGKINVTSELGNGSVFSLVLPVVPADQQQAA
jgi:signal transduction histidine kinase